MLWSLRKLYPTTGCLLLTGTKKCLFSINVDQILLLLLESIKQAKPRTVLERNHCMLHGDLKEEHNIYFVKVYTVYYISVDFKLTTLCRHSQQRVTQSSFRGEQKP